MSQLTYEKLAPILDRLVSQGVLYHANTELMRYHMLNTLQDMLPHMDEGCWERGCMGDTDFAKRRHVTDGSPCWCGAEVTYVDPDTGTKVITHKDTQ